MTEIKVTQADRERMASLEHDGRERDQILRGKRNKSPILHAFARHRIEAQRPLLEALIIALDSMESVDGENDCSRGIKSAEAAIKQAKGE